MLAVRFSVIFLAGAIAAGAELQPCAGPLAGRSALPRCSDLENARYLRESLDRIRAGKVTYAQNLSSQISQARQRYNAQAENAPGREQAKMELENLLVEKDFWFLQQEDPLLMQGVLDTFLLGRTDVKVDDGIRPFARAWFSSWENFLRDRTIRADRKEPLSKALDESHPIYDHYRLARSWAESAAQGRNITDDPGLYARVLIEIESPWLIRGVSADPNYATTVTNYYGAMNEVFGADAVKRAITRLMALPKDRDGYVSPLLQMNGRKWKTPWQAFRALLSDGDGRAYMILAIMEARSQSSEAGMRRAQTEYSRWAAAYGEKPVADAALQTARASKNEDNLIVDGSVGGLTKTQDEHIYPLIQKILIRNNPEAYVRTVLAFHDNLESAAAVQDGYTSLVARYSQQRVADAGAALAGLWVTGEYLPPAGDRTLKERRFSSKPNTGPAGDYALLTGILDGSGKLARGTVIDNPDYLLWAQYPPGTTVTYVRKSWLMKGGSLAPNPINQDVTTQTRRLRTVDAQSVTVDVSEGKSPDSTAGSRAYQVHYAARINQEETPEALADVVRKQQPTYAGKQEGTEKLEVNGKMLDCRWTKVTFRQTTGPAESTTTWISDQVPGGLVMISRDMGPLVDRTILQPYSVEKAVAMPAPESPPAGSEIPPQGRGGTSGPRSSAGITVTLTDPIDAAVADAGGTVRARVKQTSRAGAQPLLPEGTEVVLKIRKVSSSSMATQVAISMVSATINGQTVPLTGRELLRAFRSGVLPEGTTARQRNGVSGARAIGAGTDLYLVVTKPSIQ